MGSPEADKIRDAARTRIAGRPVLVVDGDPIEELAKAHDRHAIRLDGIVDSLRDVGTQNHLGNTSEGRAATHNIRVAAAIDDLSVARTIKAQAMQARTIASALRQIRTATKDAEEHNRSTIKRADQ